MYVVQMHGEPGSGKTTLARELGRVLPAVVLELDVITDALLGAGVGTGNDGRVVYEVHYRVAASIASQGFNVVLDNAVYRPEVEARSRRLAEGDEWRMIECVCADEERRRRLTSRKRMAWQATELSDWRRQAGTAEPSSERLTLETWRPIEKLVAEAERYIRGG